MLELFGIEAAVGKGFAERGGGGVFLNRKEKDALKPFSRFCFREYHIAPLYIRCNEFYRVKYYHYCIINEFYREKCY